VAIEVFVLVKHPLVRHEVEGRHIWW
jgi:hypothetical protein